MQKPKIPEKYIKGGGIKKRADLGIRKSTSNENIEATEECVGAPLKILRFGISVLLHKNWDFESGRRNFYIII